MIQTPPAGKRASQKNEISGKDGTGGRAVEGRPSVVDAKSGRRWRFSLLDLLIALFCLAGVTVFIYPIAAQWVSQYNQSNIIVDQAQVDEASGKNAATAKIAAAQRYNELLSAQAILASGANVAEGVGPKVETFDYFELLNSDPTGIMARLRIPSIDLDLPVYHGTGEDTLLKGVGHLQGTSLPVGGQGTRSVLTGHRGLASATMFTNLDKVKIGDTFTTEVMGEVFAYRVFDIKVIDPQDTEEIRAVPGRDLVTLVTCTPLGVNSHRIVITGERVDPTPQQDIDQAGLPPDVPHFPWWMVFYAAAVVLLSVWYWRSGYPRRKRERRGPERRNREKCRTERRRNPDRG